MTKHINSKFNDIKYCCRCGTKLTDENWYSFRQKLEQYICKNCNKKYNREYDRKHTLVSTNKVFYNVNKRKYPKNSICELCKKEKRRLHYHHWDDETPELGVWVCGFCHITIGQFEKDVIDNILKKYVTLKIQITKKYIFKHNIMKIIKEDY